MKLFPVLAVAAIVLPLPAIALEPDFPCYWVSPTNRLQNLTESVCQQQRRAEAAVQQKARQVPIIISGLKTTASTFGTDNRYIEGTVTNQSARTITFNGFVVGFSRQSDGQIERVDAEEVLFYRRLKPGQSVPFRKLLDRPRLGLTPEVESIDYDRN